MGLRMFSHTEVRSFDEHPGGVNLHADNGTVRHRRVVFATGYESHRYLREDVGALHSTYALISEPLTSFDGWPDGCLIWETARPYFYARQTADRRALIGGEDTPYSDDHRRDELVEQGRVLAKAIRAAISRAHVRARLSVGGHFR